jgi:4-hydroxy-tetrahydrodipicolinate synthase
MASTSSTPIQGSLVAIVTPMQPDGALDYDAFKGLLDWHLAEGTDGFVVVGTTGESPTVSVEEHVELIRFAVDHVAGRAPVIAGTGANSTAEAIELTESAKKVGADAGLSVVPYYNRPTQEGLYRHFRAIAEAVDLPLIVYNVPGRTACDLGHDTTLRLAQVPGIVGLKDATGDIGRGALLLSQLPPSFALYSGDDPTAAALMLLGARGNISVTANVAPRLMHELWVAAQAGDAISARAVNARVALLNRNLFLEPNPIPVKWALARMGRSALGYRLPLVEFASQYHAAVLDALKAAGIDV